MSDVRRRGMRYRDAGVDIDAGERFVELIKAHARSTHRREVVTDLGGFAGAFAPAFGAYERPVLVSATDGVGTKLAIAQALDRHDSVGVDLVAMIVDDLVCHRAEPLFFLDYIACGRIVPERLERVVAGIAEGCRQAGCALVGGETAEHPGTMDPDTYDLAGFGVGVAEHDRMWGPHLVQAGDVVLGIASSGLHANGYSLVRAVILRNDLDLASTPKGWSHSLGEELLVPTEIYAPHLLGLAGVRAAAHVTGGGIGGNLVRALPEGLGAVVLRTSWPEPPIFRFLQSEGDIGDDEMLRTFNMGLGMLLVVAPEEVAGIVDRLDAAGRPAFPVGEVAEGDRRVVIEG